jgi:hypothetical protein
MTEHDEIHQLAPHADGRWVGAMLLFLATFWIGAIWLVVKLVR